MPTVSENMAVVYSKNEDEDGFLYILFNENTFG